MTEQKETSPLTPLLQGEGNLPPSPSGRRAGDEGEISKLAGINRQIPQVLLQRARELRHRQTPAEQLLWECLRNRQLLGAKFRRQHNIGRYIADFYCHQSRLVMELDGGIHKNRKIEDAIRDNWFQTNGFRVLRFKNEEVLNNMEKVLDAIVENLG